MIDKEKIKDLKPLDNPIEFLKEIQILRKEVKGKLEDYDIRNLKKSLEN